MLFKGLFKEILDTLDVSKHKGFLRIRFIIFDDLEFEIKLKEGILFNKNPV